MRTIAFGYSDVGAVTIVLRRVSDGYYWNGSAFVASAPSPALSMTYDTVLDQYYTETSPTARSHWSAFDSDGVGIAYGEFGGALPDITTPPSTSPYTMQEVVDRIRTKIHDTEEYNWTDAQLLDILTGCAEWLMNQFMIHKANIGVKRATYTGDGTTEWNLPSDFLMHRKIVRYGADGTSRDLWPKSKAEYDKANIANDVDGVYYYVIDGPYVYFIDDLPTSEVVYMHYYYRLDTLELSDAVPFDGLFMPLMVQWGVVEALETDEFDTTIERRTLDRLMIDALTLLHSRSSHDRVVYSPKRDFIYAKQN